MLYFIKENWKKTEGVKTLFRKVNRLKRFIKKLIGKIRELRNLFEVSNVIV